MSARHVVHLRLTFIDSFLLLGERRRAVPSAEAGHRSLSLCSVGFEIRLLRVSGLAVRKIALQMLIFNAVGLQIRPSGDAFEVEAAQRFHSPQEVADEDYRDELHSVMVNRPIGGN